jgi:large subunit ribosomal protein L14e
MIEIGRLCVKIAGRDAGKKCVIIDIIQPNIVLIDGETRRRNCNIKHLELLEEKIELKKGADRKSVIEQFKKIGIELKEKTAKTVYTKPLRKRVLKTHVQMEKKTAKTEKKIKEKEEKKKATAEKTAEKKELKKAKKEKPAKKEKETTEKKEKNETKTAKKTVKKTTETEEEQSE